MSKIENKTKHITADLCDNLVNNARQNDRRRLNYNVHTSGDDPVQRFLNAMEPDSYIRPHFHANPPKSELFIRIQGRFGVVIFDNQGEVLETYLLDGDNPGIDIKAGVWHVIISLETGSVGLEVKEGPYVPFSGGDFAEWAPEPETEEARLFLEKMRELF